MSVLLSFVRPEVEDRSETALWRLQLTALLRFRKKYRIVLYCTHSPGSSFSQQIGAFRTDRIRGVVKQEGRPSKNEARRRQEEAMIRP